MRAPSRRVASTTPAPLPGRVSFALVCALVIALTMAALLALNIAVARSSYAQDELSGRLQRLTEEQQALTEDLELRQAPSSLEREASELGMVPANRAFVSLEDGELLGDASPAQEPPSAEELAEQERQDEQERAGAGDAQDDVQDDVQDDGADDPSDDEAGPPASTGDAP